ncbi:MAG: NUDIX domain-containing protein [Candidatus Niyogibacteria bacterium]|nr:NUDIX domain-containing protein [Candidatus Niyogibacteria bacterium]
MKKYTVGFVFNQALDKVLLIHKNRPEWQKGKLNGVGGHIEPDEESADCMVREVFEETGLQTKKEDWVAVGAMQGENWVVDVYGLRYAGDTNDAVTKTDEHVEWHPVHLLPAHTLTNIPWLVHLSLDKMMNDQFHRCDIRYKS